MNTTSTAPPPPHRTGRRWLHRLAWGAAGIAVLWLAAWLAVPPLVRWQGEKQLGALLGREVRIGAVQFEPWSLVLAIDDLVVGPPAPGEADPAGVPFARIGRIRVDLEARSLIERAPVIRAIEVNSPRLVFARTAAGRYDIDDVLARLAPQPAAPASEPLRFAVYNVQLRDGSLHFADRPAGRTHVVDGVVLTLPFLSNLPADVAVKVEPRLALRANGVGFDTGASATPFAKDRAGELRLDFKALDLAPYLGYLPASLPARLRQGRISADLALRFAVDPAGVASLVVQGKASADDVAVTDPAGAPLLAWKHLEIGLADLQPLARRLDFGVLRLEGADARVRRDAQGVLDWQRLAGADPAAPSASASASPTLHSTAPSAMASAAVGGNDGAKADAKADAKAVAKAGVKSDPKSDPKAGAKVDTKPPAAAGAPWRVRAERIEVEGATLRWDDAGTRPAAVLRASGLALRAERVRWPMDEPIGFSVEAALHSGEGAAVAGRLRAEGKATDRDAVVGFGVESLALESLAPYVAQVLAARLAGQATVRGRIDWSVRGAAPALAVAIDEATLDALRLVEGGAGRAAAEPAALKQLLLVDTQVDVARSSVSVGSLRLVQPALTLARDGVGGWNFARWIAAGPPPAAARPAAGAAGRVVGAAPAGPGAAGAPVEAWKLRVRNFAIDGARVRFSDAAIAPEGADPPLSAEATDLRLAVQDFAWPVPAGAPPARAQLALRIGSGRNPAGLLEWKGQFVADPLVVRGALRAERLPLHLAAPYAMRRLADPPRVGLLRAEAGFVGQVAVRATPAGLDLQTSGDAQLTDVLVHEKPGPGAGPSAGDELLSWHTLTLKGLSVAAPPADRPRIDIAEATLANFYSRLVITEQGRFNVLDVAPAAAAAASAPAPAASLPAGAPQGLPVVLAVGGVNLGGGRIDFTDRFIRPNYSADLTELAGRLGAFRSDSREMATLDLRGRAAGTARLEIVGSINPTADPLALDIRAKATDLELAPLSAYAGKYAGYAIERGKLSMDVAYRIDPDGRLDAKNQVILNQLTFGDKIESPEATRLPVLLAVALLKDRNGVIDINLPVSGSINDPQFSVFGIVLKIIGNLLVKALTAPFALLAGGGGEDLSFVEFAPGAPQLREGGRAVLDKVAGALADRPALRLTVTGLADAVAEREAFQRASLESRLATERRRELARAGEPLADLAAPLGAEDRSRVVRELYRTAELPDKPRNALGLALDIPVAEMEALLRSRLPATTDLMRELALARAVAVRDALIAKGLPSERVFLAAPKLHAPGDEGAASWTPRAQLQLSTQ